MIIYANMIATMENFVASDRVEYTCIASSLKIFVLSDSSIAMNLSKCDKTLFICVRVKKHFIAAFLKMNSF